MTDEARQNPKDVPTSVNHDMTTTTLAFCLTCKDAESTIERRRKDANRHAAVLIFMVGFATTLTWSATLLGTPPPWLPTYPWREELDKDGLAIGHFIVVVWCQTDDIVSADRSSKGKCESSGNELHGVVCWSCGEGDVVVVWWSEQKCLGYLYSNAALLPE